MALLKFTESGIYCPQGQFYIDPWHKVDKAIITHAHADHARHGMQSYLCHFLTEPILKLRLGFNISVQTLEYNQPIYLNGVKVSLHPAGHIIGSAQIRVEYHGEVWVVSGDYKINEDGISTPFEPLKCHHFITESTFGLPVFRWEHQKVVFNSINQWWIQNKSNKLNTVLIGYSLGKAQRIIQNIDPNIGNIFTHNTIKDIHQAYRNVGIQVRDSLNAGLYQKNEHLGSLILAPPATINSKWLSKFEPFQIAVASGWMTFRGTKRRQNIDNGFILSDHADWTELLKAIKNTHAENIYITHGYTHILSRYLIEIGYNAQIVNTRFTGEDIQASDETLDGVNLEMVTT
jgi:putative mRNA 3-end processing factor